MTPTRNRRDKNMSQAKNTKLISASILYLLTNGVDTKEAFDFVLGAGSYDRMVSDLYDQLRAKALAG